MLCTTYLVAWNAGYAGNVAADEAAAKAGDLIPSEPDSPEPPKSILHTEVDASCNQVWRHLWDNTLGHRQTRS